MKRITAKLNESLSNFPDDKNKYNFKQKKLEELSTRYTELVESGMSDMKVCEDIILSEHPDFAAEYTEYLDKKTKKNASKFVRNWKKFILGSMLCWVLLVVAYLAVSFLTHAWAKSWLILIGGAVVQLGVFSVVSLTDKIKHHIARNLSARFFCESFVMLASVFAFFVAWLIFDVSKGYVIIIGGVALALIVDLLISVALKSKFSFAKFLAYLPFVAAIVYLCLGLTVANFWNPGWLIILGAVIVDIIILLVKGLMKTSKKESEGEE